MTLIAILQTVPALGMYAIVGGLVGVESLGIPVPGETALLTGALLSTHPQLHIAPVGVAVAAFTGAVIGDSIGYAVGRRYGRALFDRLGARFPRHFSGHHVAYAEHLFSRYGMAAVFGGRFVALLRILAGPLAGSLRMRYPRFLLANVCGAACWAGGITMLVYALGTAAHTYIADVSWILLGVVVVLAFIGSRYLHRDFERRVRDFAALAATG